MSHFKNLEERELFKAMGEALLTIAARLEVEPGGDKVSLASTNDADTLRDMASAYDEWFWKSPEGKKAMAEED